MPRRLIVILFIAAVIALPSCGGDDGNPTTSEPAAEETSATEGSAEDIEVIRAWAEAISESDMDAAAEYFAIPSVAENGITVNIETRDDAVLFNESLPCGAELESTEEQGEFITATFRLKARPGVPACPGDGNVAHTSFVIEDGAIVEWRRVALPGPEADEQAT